MRKLFFILLSLFILGLVLYFIRLNNQKTPIAPALNSPTASEIPVGQPSSGANPEQNPNSSLSPKEFISPLDRVGERVTKKPFGIFITPVASPVQPERFYSYHTGTDFEIFPDELNKDVSVKAVCSGKLLLKEYASGYGGVAVQNCILNSQPITVIYGHLKLASISVSTGQKISQGDTLGILGANKSAETDGERKHLHLGFRRGAPANIRGYVSSQSELSSWINPCLYACQ